MAIICGSDDCSVCKQCAQQAAWQVLCYKGGSWLLCCGQLCRHLCARQFILQHPSLVPMFKLSLYLQIRQPIKEHCASICSAPQPPVKRGPLMASWLLPVAPSEQCL